MSALLLSILLTIAPLEWDGRVWLSLSPESKLTWAGGAISGLSIASYLKDDPLLEIRVVGPDWIVTELDGFYLEVSRRKINIADALMLIGGKRKPAPEYNVPIPTYR